MIKAGKVKTLVDQFWYPRLGAGQFYVKLIKQIERVALDYENLENTDNFDWDLVPKLD